MQTNSEWKADELYALMTTVGEQLGEDVVNAALNHAFTVALEQHQAPVTKDALQQGGIATNGHQFIPLGVLYDALLAELRRVARPH